MFFKTNARTLQAIFPSLAIVTDGLNMALASPSPSPGSLEAITSGPDVEEKKRLAKDAPPISSLFLQSPHPSDTITTVISRTSTGGRRRRIIRDETPKGGGKARSVKNIVAWLESSKARGKPPPGSQPSASSGSKTSLPSAVGPASSGGAPQIPEFSFQTHPDVEDYSLTLLKYRQYFTETPLGRYLDSEASSSRGEQRNVGLAPGGVFAVGKGESGDHHQDDHRQRVESKNKGGESLEASAHTPPPHTPRRQNSNLDSTSEKTSNISASTKCENMPGIITTITTASHDYNHDYHHPHPHHHHTSSTRYGPQDGAAFWASVRAALWIPDEEMAEYSARRQAQRSDAAALRSPRSPSRPAPSPRLPKSPMAKRLSRSNGGRAQRCSAAAAAAAAPAQESPRRGLAHGRARGVPWRRLNGSGPPSDKVIDEIDEFLGGEEAVAAALYAQDDVPPPLTLQPKGISHSKSGSLPASMPSYRRRVAETHGRQQQQRAEAPRRRIPSYIRERYDGITEMPGERSQERHEFMIMYPDGQRTVWI
ncbi:hypothetical protein N3K66_004246 [Trichothecium roseum]|uniref:Uncharacterized protein n=1 Tax=Trichothecium roseum TaxID=47278 RepID=A0ACC0V0Q2_9HYPO|nr:hypothetical protein N3K66_004246 [Trichothecium roseum]